MCCCGKRIQGLDWQSDSSTRGMAQVFVLHQGLNPSKYWALPQLKSNPALCGSVPALLMQYPRTTNSGHSKRKSDLKEINWPVIIYRKGQLNINWNRWQLLC